MEYFVNVDKTYFYKEPTKESKGKPYIIVGESIIVTKEGNGFLYGTYTNDKGKEKSGWFLKSDSGIFAKNFIL